MRFTESLSCKHTHISILNRTKGNSSHLGNDKTQLPLFGHFQVEIKKNIVHTDKNTRQTVNPPPTIKQHVMLKA